MVYDYVNIPKLENEAFNSLINLHIQNLKINQYRMKKHCEVQPVVLHVTHLFSDEITKNLTFPNFLNFSLKIFRLKKLNTQKHN